MTTETTPEPSAMVAEPVAFVAPTAVVAPVVAPVAVQVTLPGKDATPADWSKYYADIGAPKDATGYELPVPEGVDGAFAKEAATAMAKVGLLPNQASALAAWWNERVSSTTEAGKAAATAAETARVTAADAAAKRDDAALRNEWGTAADQNMEHAKRAAREFVTPFAGDKTADIITAIENSIGYAATMKLMHAIGSKIGEAQPRGLGTSPAPKANGMYEQLQESIRASLGPK